MKHKYKAEYKVCMVDFPEGVIEERFFTKGDVEAKSLADGSLRERLVERENLVGTSISRVTLVTLSRVEDTKHFRLL